MKVNKPEFSPIMVTFETAEEYAAFITILIVAWNNTTSGEPASNLVDDLSKALDADVT